MATYNLALQPRGASDAPPVTLELGVSSALEIVARGLADLKLDLDRFSLDEETGQPFINDWFDSRTGTCAFTGHEFLQRIVPFLDHSEAMGAPFRAYVDPALVLGASIGGYPESIRGEEIAKRRARYAREFDVIYLQRAEYYWIEPLGIIWAFEGKHRVAFMRAHGEPAIAAWVTRRNYLAPDRIVLVEPTEDRLTWFAILDGRYLQLVQRPALTQRLLSAYGVKTVRWRDLADAPSEHYVRHAIVDWQQLDWQQRRRKYPDADGMLDLNVLRAEERRARELVPHTLTDFENAGWKIQHGRQLAYALLAIVAGLILELVFHAGVMRALGFGLIGFGVGLSLVASTLRLVGPRGRGDVG
ncbi:hypothetical protein [Burkholderia sp. HI2500]|uniref:hypothetical protein n=1 Tax=Burkholderia sp. HI2500 TaxID=2015358 RepID=UPI000B7A66D3|nr:hypothetical protein [Burkholderia sp. HI2500]OXJ06748.1 hypothetical protein CFB45_37425 [Burkholderia sp. HI2500]